MLAAMMMGALAASYKAYLDLSVFSTPTTFFSRLALGVVLFFPYVPSKYL